MSIKIFLPYLTVSLKFYFYLQMFAICNDYIQHEELVHVQNTSFFLLYVFWKKFEKWKNKTNTQFQNKIVGLQQIIYWILFYFSDTCALFLRLPLPGKRQRPSLRPFTSSSSTPQPAKLVGQQARLRGFTRRATCVALKSGTATSSSVRSSGPQIILEPTSGVLSQKWTCGHLRQTGWVM